MRRPMGLPSHAARWPAGRKCAAPDADGKCLTDAQDVSDPPRRPDGVATRAAEPHVPLGRRAQYTTSVSARREAAPVRAAASRASIDSSRRRTVGADRFVAPPHRGRRSARRATWRRDGLKGGVRSGNARVFGQGPCAKGAFLLASGYNWAQMPLAWRFSTEMRNNLPSNSAFRSRTGSFDISCCFGMTIDTIRYLPFCRLLGRLVFSNGKGLRGRRPSGCDPVKRPRHFLALRHSETS